MEEIIIFEDPDGGGLVYSATVEDTMIAKAEILGTHLKVIPKKRGQTSIDVFATDHFGGKAKSSFTFTIPNTGISI